MAMKHKKYDLMEADFERFRSLINKSCGIYFDRGKLDLLRLGLSDRAESVGAEDLGEYYDFLTTSDEREGELRLLLSHLSVQETHFFRNLPQFDALRKYVIPEISRRKAAGHRHLRFWSAGCSTGQEPYSIAMSVCDVLPEPHTWDIRILGTDLSDNALEIAANGWYPENKTTGLDREHLNRYFHSVDDGYQIDDSLRSMVSFTRHNMVADALPLEAFGTCDAIFCRNVIIYFTHQTAKQAIEMFFDILNPGGYLFLGHSETLWKMSAKYSLVEMGDAFIYKKSLPRAIDGRRFIADRRLRDMPLPEGVSRDRRRAGRDRRGETGSSDLLIMGSSPVQADESEPPVAESATDSHQATCVKCRKLIDLGEYAKVIEILTGADSERSIDCQSYYILGLALEKTGEADRAIDAFKKALYCDDSHSLAAFHLASNLELKGDLKPAIKEYRNAVKRLNSDPADRWEQDLEAFDICSLVDLCQWKIENLGSIDS